MTFHLDPLAAVTSQNPHETYASLRDKGTMFWLEHRRTWVATTDAAVRAVLLHPDSMVRPPSEPVPLQLAETVAGEVFARLVRMNDGDRHRSGKVAIERALRSIPLDHVRAESRRQAAAMEAIAVSDIAFFLPVRVVGRLLGISAPRLEHLPVLVRDFARCIGPGARGTDVAPWGRGGRGDVVVD